MYYATEYRVSTVYFIDLWMAAPAIVTSTRKRPYLTLVTATTVSGAAKVCVCAQLVLLLARPTETEFARVLLLGKPTSVQAPTVRAIASSRTVMCPTVPQAARKLWTAQRGNAIEGAYWPVAQAR